MWWWWWCVWSGKQKYLREREEFFCVSVSVCVWIFFRQCCSLKLLKSYLFYCPNNQEEKKGERGEES